MFIRGMNRALFFLLFLTGGFCGCGSKGSGHREPVAKTLADLRSSMQKDTIADLDTSLISLKKQGAVALETVMSQRWTFEDADQPHWNEVFWDSATDTRQYPELVFFPDHAVTANARCVLQIGNWQLNKDTREIRLHFKNGSTRGYLVRQIALKQMELGWPREDGMAVIKVKADGLVHRRVEEDPFYPANNQWRFRPAVAENSVQIRRRIRDCVHFYSLFFLDNNRRQEREISFSGLPSCFVWYNGGIGMQSRLELDKKWIACFFSEAQAYTAYDMIADELGKHSLHWPEHPTSWVKQTGEVLGQLAGKL